QLEAFANFAGAAIQNARLLEQEQTLRKQAETLQQVSNTISAALDLHQVAQMIIDELQKVVEYKTASMQLIEGENREMIAGAGFDRSAISETLLKPLSEDALIRRVVDSREPLVLSDVSQDPDWESRQDTVNVRSWIGVPLVYADQVIGLLTLDHDKTSFYTDDVKTLLMPFASQAAIAINNARSVQRLQSLHEIGIQINASLKLGDILTNLVKEAMRLTQTESGIVYVLDEAAENIVQSYAYPERFTHPVPRVSREGYTRRIIDSREQQVVQDAQNDPLVNPEIKKLGIQSFVGTPLKSADQVVGVLYINDESARQFTTEDLVLLETLADQAAVAIKNAQLFEQLEQRNTALDVLRTVAEKLTTGTELSESDILNTIYEQAGKLMTTNNFYIALYESDPRQPDVYDSCEPQKNAVYGTVRFGLMYVDGKPTHVESRKATPGEYGRTEAILCDRTPILNRTRAESQAWYGQPGRQEFIGQTFASWLGVPMIVGDRVVGVIATYHAEKENLFNEEGLRVLSLLAGPAAIALENVRLVQQLDQRTQELQTLYEMAQTFSAGDLSAAAS
ncbi:MAG: GAF domain-containing protein, partial [Anaerolineae bacterium]|nr:GAF domain-containing protein [Anaerolineae bacterium]